MQASGEFHTAEHEALPFRSNTADIPTSIKSEDSGWLINRGAPLLDGELVCLCDAVMYSAQRTSIKHSLRLSKIMSIRDEPLKHHFDRGDVCIRLIVEAGVCIRVLIARAKDFLLHSSADLLLPAQVGHMHIF